MGIRARARIALAYPRTFVAKRASLVVYKWNSKAICPNDPVIEIFDFLITRRWRTWFLSRQRREMWLYDDRSS